MQFAFARVVEESRNSVTAFLNPFLFSFLSPFSFKHLAPENIKNRHRSRK